ncbi:MAG: TonB-dependent receptor plug domain-containing protein, partial [Porticoccaceae bacterium]
MKKISLLAATIALSAAPALVQSTYASEAEIQEVLVSASLIPIAASRSANAITVIDSEQLKLRAALSVSDLLRDVPGLAVSRSGVQGSLTQIRARGNEANHLLVLIDGVEANDPSQSDELSWGTLAADDIER